MANTVYDPDADERHDPLQTGSLGQGPSNRNKDVEPGSSLGGKNSSAAISSKALADNEKNAADDSNIKYSKEPAKTKKKSRFNWSKKKVAIAGGIAGVSTGGVLMLSVTTLGPFQLIHYSQILQGIPAMQNNENATKTRMTALWRWAKSGDIGETRLSLVGSKMNASIQKRLAKSGVTLTTDKLTGQLNKVTVDPEKVADKTRLNQKNLAEDNGVKLSDVTFKDGKWEINTSKASISANRDSISNALKGLDEPRLKSHLMFRTLTKYLGAPSWLHPFERIGAAGDKKLASLQIFKNIQEKRTAKINARSPETKARIAKIKATSGIIGGALIATSAVCVAKDLAAQFPALNYDIVQKPSMISAGDGAAQGDQVKYNSADLNAGVVSESARNMTDANGKSAFDSAAIRYERGLPGGIELAADIKQGYSPDTTAAAIEKELDSYGADALCSGIGVGLQVVAGVALIAMGPAGWATKAVTGAAGAVIGAVTVAAITSYGEKLMSDSMPVIGEPHVGPDGGGVDASGMRLAASAAAIAGGGVVMSQANENSIRTAVLQDRKAEFDSKSLFARVFDINDSRTLVATLVDTQSTDPGKNIVKIANTLANGSGLLKTFSSIFSPKAAAAEVSYDYGFPIYGMLPEEVENPGLGNPYDNADKVKTLLTSDPSYIDKALTCFGVKIDPAKAYAVVAQQPVNTYTDDYKDANCADPGPTSFTSNNLTLVSQTTGKTTTDTVKTVAAGDPSDWLRIRTYVLDSRIMDSDACYTLDDNEACANVGIPTATSPAVDNASGNSTATTNANYAECMKTATGNGTVVCSAYLFDPLEYFYGAPARGDWAFLACVKSNFAGDCASKYPPGASRTVDCSTLVTYAIYDALKVDIGAYNTGGMVSSPHLKQISDSEAQAGDIVLVGGSHTEVIVSNDKAGQKFNTYGAHQHYPDDPAKDVSPASYAYGKMPAYRVVP